MQAKQELQKRIFQIIKENNIHLESKITYLEAQCNSQRLSHPVPDRMFEKFDLACPVPDGRVSRWGGAGFTQDS
jgi:hypothetical protein